MPLYNYELPEDRDQIILLNTQNLTHYKGSIFIELIGILPQLPDPYMTGNISLLADWYLISSSEK